MDRLAQERRPSAAGAIAFGIAVAAAGLYIAAAAFTHLDDAPPAMAQATQLPAAADTRPAPAEPAAPRPTTPAPEPARPDADAQKAGAKPALPPAPPEKMGKPVPERK